MTWMDDRERFTKMLYDSYKTDSSVSVVDIIDAADRYAEAKALECLRS